MALSNAEKQAAWRARQAENKKRVAELEAEVARLNKRLAESAVSNPPKPAKSARQAKAEGTAEARAEPQIPLDALSMSAQQKMAAWQRQTEKRLREQIEHEERAKIQSTWNETILPHYKKKLTEAERVIKARKGVWGRAFFRKLLACIHPDRSSSSDAPEVFRAVKDAEFLLCKEAEMPTTSVGMPQTVEELLARRRQGRRSSSGGY